MSFQVSGTVGKASEVKKTLEAQVDQQVKALPTDFIDDAAGREAGAAAERQADELQQLSVAGIAAAEAAVRKLDGSSYQITVSGHHDPTGLRSISVSVSAVP